MAKISQVSAKYIVHSNIDIDGVVDRPDVIGAIFGQTEGLLGADLELRELQRSGRIGRIEVNVDTKGGKTHGSIIIPSSLDKAETAIVGAALEIIQRIGPCNAKIRVEKIEDVRVSKRSFVVERAKELLKNLMEGVMPDSQELADEVAYSVRVMEMSEYGRDRLPSGPAIDDADEILLVEGRADVLNLLKHGFKNIIAVNGTNIPQTIVELCKKKNAVAFLDGDRGGDIILKELFAVAEIDYVCRAPDGKEVEEITKKEIHKSLRARVSAEQAKLDLERREETQASRYGRPQPQQRGQQRPQLQPHRGPQRPPQRESRPQVQHKQPTVQEKDIYRNMLEDLIGTHGAVILDQKLNVLGKVPNSELSKTLGSIDSGVYAVVLDGDLNRDMLSAGEKAGVTHLVCMESLIQKQESRVAIITAGEL